MASRTPFSWPPDGTFSWPLTLIAIELINEAKRSGARLRLACRELGISIRTYQRWTREGDDTRDKRPEAIHPKVSFALSETEVQQVLDICHKEEFSSASPSQIVPVLADRGIYLASESSFYRILRRYNQNKHRGRAKASVRRERPSHRATSPLEIWVTDISWLRGPAYGIFYYLYFVMDLYSRKIVGYEVYEGESSHQLATVIQRATFNEGARAPKILHSDNGSPMKGVSLLELCYQLGIATSNSRPSVSDDNPHIEALFRTTKYWPGYPYGGFGDLTGARAWVSLFVSFYNHVHRHSGLNFVTPNEMHTGAHLEILHKRSGLYEHARSMHPERWRQGSIRNWSPTTETWTTPPNVADVRRPLLKATG